MEYTINRMVEVTIYRTKTQTNRPKLTLEGLVMTIFYCSEFKKTNMNTNVICVLRHSRFPQEWSTQ